MTIQPSQIAELAARWRKPRATPLYTLSLVLMAGVSLLLILIYLSIIGGLGYVVVRSGATLLALFNDTQTLISAPRAGERDFAASLLFAVFPLILGSCLLLFLLKPLLAPRHTPEDTIEVFRSEESRLYQFVESVCLVIGAPTPARIDVTSIPNASAGFGGGLLSLFKRDTLVLTLGMPLITGLTSGQLAGIIAHELGHFSQSAAMRALFLTGIVEQWLARAAFGRDAWDARINALLRASPPLVVWVLLIALKMGIGLARLVLKALLYAGSLAGMALRRQMEHDADRYEYRFAGSEAFAQACERLEALWAGFPRAERIAADMWAAGKQVPDDMPALIADASLRITPEERASMARSRRTERDGFFLTHPPMRTRLARAAQAAEPGIYHNTEPASSLCTDASIYSRRVTYGLYKDRLGGYLREATFVPVAKVLTPRVADHARKGLAERYFGFEPPTWRPVWLSMRTLPKDVELRPTAERLKKAINAVRAAGPAAHQAAGVYREANERRLRCEQAASLLDAHLKVDWRRLEIARTSRSLLGHEAQTLQQRVSDATPAIDDGLDAAAMRLGAALTLLAAPGIEKYVDKADQRRARVNELLPVMAGLRSVFPLAAEVREGMGKVSELIGAIRNEDTFKAARESLRPLADAIRANVLHARQECGGVHYPFRPANTDDDHAHWEALGVGGAASNLGQRLAPHTPGHREFNDIFDAGSVFTDRFVEELGRTTGELVEIAAAVEEGLRTASAAKKAAANE